MKASEIKNLSIEDLQDKLADYQKAASGFKDEPCSEST